MSVTMPVNIWTLAPFGPEKYSLNSLNRLKSTSQTDVAFPQIVPDSLDAQATELGGVGQLCKGQGGDAGPPLPAQQDRGAKPFQRIDGVGAQERRRDLPSAPQ